MKRYPESEWRKYKTDFLSANNCTDDQFEVEYVAFMESHGLKPNTKAYRHFARKYGITIQPEPNLPEDMRVVLSVSISAMKVMSKTFAESEDAIQELLLAIPRKATD